MSTSSDLEEQIEEARRRALSFSKSLEEARKKELEALQTFVEGSESLEVNSLVFSASQYPQPSEERVKKLEDTIACLTRELEGLRGSLEAETARNAILEQTLSGYCANSAVAGAAAATIEEEGLVTLRRKLDDSERKVLQLEAKLRAAEEYNQELLSRAVVAETIAVQLQKRETVAGSETKDVTSIEEVQQAMKTENRLQQLMADYVISNRGAQEQEDQMTLTATGSVLAMENLPNALSPATVLKCAESNLNLGRHSAGKQSVGGRPQQIVHNGRYTKFSCKLPAAASSNSAPTRTKPASAAAATKSATALPIHAASVRSKGPSPEFLTALAAASEDNVRRSLKVVVPSGRRTNRVGQTIPVARHTRTPSPSTARTLTGARTPSPLSADRARRITSKQPPHSKSPNLLGNLASISTDSPDRTILSGIASLQARREPRELQHVFSPTPAPSSRSLLRSSAEQLRIVAARQSRRSSRSNGISATESSKSGVHSAPATVKSNPPAVGGSRADPSRLLTAARKVARVSSSRGNKSGPSVSTIPSKIKK